jgi:signal peptidase II
MGFPSRTCEPAKKFLKGVYLQTKPLYANKFIFLAIMLFLGVALDQISKNWVAQAIPKHTVIPVIPDLFNLVHVYNRGAAFGLLSSWSPEFVRFFFIGTNLAIAAVLVYLYWRTSTEYPIFLWGYSLILSGALGNLIDRIRYGEVLDFLDFYIGRHHWPAFNVADSLICIGAGFLVLAMWRFEGEKDVSHPV